MRNGSIWLLLAVVIFSPDVSAHVKWFVNVDHVTHSSHTVPQFGIGEIEVQVVLICVLCIFFAAGLVDRLLRRYRIGEKASSSMIHSIVVRIAEVVAGSSLFYSAINGALFAPNITGSGSAFRVLLFFEFIVAIQLIANFRIGIACYVLVLLYAVVGAAFNALFILEAFNFVGLASLLVLYHSGAKHLSSSGLYRQILVQRGLAVYRMSLGVALITLGLSEKLLQPEMALDFLRQYPEVNFMKLIGLEFPDRLFILCCGAVEVLFGTVYLAGFVTRINTVVLAIFLVLSNSYFFLIDEVDEAIMEVFGHMPLFSGALVLFVMGGGNFHELSSTRSRNELVGLESIPHNVSR